MEQAQTLLGLHRIDLPAGSQVSGLDLTINFYSPRPGIASPGFNTLTRSTNGSWVSQGRLGRDPAFQWTGNSEETIIIEGRLYPHLFGGLKTLDRLRQATKGQRFILTRFWVEAEYSQDGTPTGAYQYNSGVIPGPWGVRNVKQGELKIGAAGLPDVVEFHIELVMLGEDPGDGAANEFFFGAREGYKKQTES